MMPTQSTFHYTMQPEKGREDVFLDVIIDSQTHDWSIKAALDYMSVLQEKLREVQIVYTDKNITAPEGYIPLKRHLSDPYVSLGITTSGMESMRVGIRGIITIDQGELEKRLQRIGFQKGIPARKPLTPSTNNEEN